MIGIGAAADMLTGPGIGQGLVMVGFIRPEAGIMAHAVMHGTGAAGGKSLLTHLKNMESTKVSNL